MQITGSERQFEAAKKKLLENLVKSLNDQFCVGKTEDEAKVLKTSCIANLKLWPEDLDDDPGYKETFKMLLFSFSVSCTHSVYMHFSFSYYFHLPKICRLHQLSLGLFTPD